MIEYAIVPDFNIESTGAAMHELEVWSTKQMELLHRKVIWLSCPHHDEWITWNGDFVGKVCCFHLNIVLDFKKSLLRGQLATVVN